MMRLGIYLECEKQQEGFNAVKAAVHKVAQKEVVCVGALPANLEQLLQIIKLPVNIAANLMGWVRCSAVHQQRQ